MLTSSNKSQKKRKVEERVREIQARHHQCRKRHACHTKCRSMSPSAPRATQSEGGCRQVPRLPRKVERRHREPSAPPEAGQCQAARLPCKVHVSMSPSATPATQKSGVTGNQVHHQSQASAISGTPATQSARGCHQVPRLPRKVKVDVAKCHACHAKSRSMWPSCVCV